MIFFSSNIEELKARRDVEGLVEALKDSDWSVRWEAARALGEIGDRRAVEPLIEALKDSDVRGVAADALGKIGDERAVEPLIEALKDNDEWVRERAAKALGKIGGERAVEPLIEALKDSNRFVRANAAEALGKIGDLRAVEPLIEALDDVDVHVQIEAARALHKIGNERADEALKHKRVVERLIEALKDSDGFVRAKAADALGEIGDERAVEPLIEALEDSYCIEALGDKQLRPVRLSAALALGKIGEKAKRECELLIERLKNLNNLGIDTKIERRKLKHALKELEEGNDSAAIKIKECKEGLKRKINEQIERAEELVEEASVPEAEELLEKAESALETCDYENAVKLAKQAEEKALRTLRKVKPEIEIDIPLKEYKLNYWKRTKFILKNKGNVHARGVEIELSDVVSAELIGKVDLNAGEEKELEVVLKPKEMGEVPLRVKLKYKDLKGREYESERVFLINVVDAEREESEKGRKEPSINIERGIYDPCKGGFLEGEFRRMKEWVNRYDPYAYWLVLSIQNKTGKAIEEWGVELETSSALKFEEARVEGVEYAIKVYESHPEPFRSRYAVGIPKEYGIFIPDGGSHRIYLKMRAEKPKTEYEIRGVFKYAGLKVPVRPKRFKYLCDARTDAEALRVELEKTYTKRDAARLALAFKIIQEMDRMCERRVAKTGEFLEKLSLLKDYTEGLSGKFTKQVEEFARFMKEEQFEYLDEKYKIRVKNLCTRLIDIWISEFLK